MSRAEDVPKDVPMDEIQSQNSAHEATVSDNDAGNQQAAQDDIGVPGEQVTSCPPPEASGSDLPASPARQDSDVPAEEHAAMLIEEQAPAQLEQDEVNRTLIFTPMPAPFGEIHASPQVR